MAAVLTYQDRGGKWERILPLTYSGPDEAARELAVALGIADREAVADDLRRGAAYEWTGVFGNQCLLVAEDSPHVPE